MTHDSSVERPGPDAVEANGDTRSRRAASEVAALVATQVRDAIAGAERSADEVRGRASEEASADRAGAHDIASQVLARIGELEDRVAQLFGDLRTEAAEIAEALDSPGETAQAGATEGPPLTEPAAPDALTPQPQSATAKAEPGRDPADRRVDQPRSVDEPAVRSPADALAWTGPAAAGSQEQPSRPAAGRDGVPAAADAGAQPADHTGAGLPADQPDHHEWPTPERTTSSEPLGGPSLTGPPVHEEAGAVSPGRDEDGDSIRREDTAEEHADEPEPETGGAGTDPKPLAWPAEEGAGTASGEDEHAPGAAKRRRGLFRHRRDG